MKHLVTILLCVFFSCTAFSQTMLVHTRTQDVSVFSLSQIDSITFSWSTPPVDSLMAYYPFSGNADDGSGNGHHGTVNGATLVPDRFGNLTGAYSFNGSTSWITIGPVHPPANNSTISYWQKGDSANLTEKWLMGDAYSFRGVGFVKYSSDSVSFEIQQISGSGRRSVTAHLDNAERAQWTHIVGVSQNGTLSIYKNGVLQRSTSGFLGDQGTYDFYIGRSHAGSSFYWRGSLDDIRVYNRALSADEIQALYHEVGW